MSARHSTSRFAVICAFLAASCGIEVGNPRKPTQPTTGAINLALADAPVDDAQHVYLNLVSLSIIPDGDELGVAPVPVKLDVSGKIDALALRDGKSLDLTTAQGIPSGSYHAVVLGLDPENAATLVDKNGAEHPLSRAGDSIVVPQRFTVTSDSTLALVLHIDLRRSIRQADSGPERRFEFSPVAHMNRHRDEGSITGTVKTAGAAQICAYLKRGGEKHRPPPDLDHPDDRPPPIGAAWLPSNATLAVPPPSFTADQMLDPMTDSACSKAFASAVVTDGVYRLEHLWPGYYQLVAVNSDGASLGNAPEVSDLPPGEAQTLDFP